MFMVKVPLKLPSGKLTWLWEITIFNGKIHYFYGHFPVRYGSLPEGTSHKIQLNHHFPMVFLWFSYGFHHQPTEVYIAATPGHGSP